MYYATICAIAKDENVHLKEWLLFHLALGFEHIVIYDNNSKVPISTELAEYVAAGLVTVIDCPLTRAQQLSVYFDCLKRMRGQTFWLAFIDIDEFIVPMHKTDIRDLLDEYRQHAALGMHWLMFSSNGHIGRPATGGMLENYTASLGLNPHIKSIVRPDLTVKPVSAHHCQYKEGHYCVNEDHVIVHSFCSFPVGQKVRVNHYYYRSQQDFEEKIARGLVTQMVSGTERSMLTFYEHLDNPTHEDTKIQAWLPLVRKFGALPPDRLATLLAAPLASDEAEGIASISTHLAQGDITRARREYALLSRYHHSPQLAIVAASLAFWEDDNAGALGILSQALLEYAEDREAVALLFGEIARHYERTGQKDTAASVREFVQF